MNTAGEASEGVEKRVFADVILDKDAWKMNTAVEVRKRVEKRVFADVNVDKNACKQLKSTHEQAYDESVEFRIALELQSVLEQYVEARKLRLKSFDLTIWDERHEEAIDVILDLMRRFGYEPDGDETFDDPYRIITFVALRW